MECMRRKSKTQLENTREALGDMVTTEHRMDHYEPVRTACSQTATEPSDVKEKASEPPAVRASGRHWTSLLKGIPGDLDAETVSLERRTPVWGCAFAPNVFVNMQSHSNSQEALYGKDKQMQNYMFGIRFLERKYLRKAPPHTDTKTTMKRLWLKTRVHMWKPTSRRSR